MHAAPMNPDELDRLRQLVTEQDQLIQTLREQIRNLVALHAPTEPYRHRHDQNQIHPPG